MDRYPEYRDSGIELIGEIPSHWELLAIKRLLKKGKDSMRTGPFGSHLKTTDYVNEGVRVYNQRTVYDDDYLSGDTFITRKQYQTLKNFEVAPRDLLITTRGTIGKVSMVPDFVETGVIHPCLIRFRINEDVLFIPYIINFINDSSIFISNILYQSDATTIEVIYSDSLREALVPLPPLREQIQISVFLDQKSFQIDSLVERLERKVELLKEYRTALISQCVTKGLDPNVEMKDSRIEWVGEIPKHWEIGLLKHYCAYINIKRHAKKDEIKISPENIEFGNGKILNHHSSYENMGMEFEPGDTLLNKLRVYLAKVVFCEFPGLSMGEMIVLRPTKMYPKFQFYLILSYRFIDNLNSLSEGVKMPRTPIEGIMNSSVPIPNYSEQLQISQHLDRKTTRIDSLIEKLEQKIALQKEYRQSLISHIVTGKVRVTENEK